jgi:hypothetical protein
MSIPDSFDNEESLYNFLDKQGLFLRKPSPVLKLRPPIPKPATPESYRGFNTNYPYVMQAPENDPNFAFVGNRDTFEGNWHRIGDPITPENVGKTTYGAIGQDKTFGSQHHNVNLPRESNLTDDELQDRLRNFNLPAEGDRSSLFKRLINAQESPELMQKIGNGEAPTELDLADIVNRHEPINLQQAARLRELRNNQGNPPQANQAQENSSWWQNSNLNPTNWMSQNNPTRLDGTQVSNAEANSLRQWGEQNLETQANNTSLLNRLGTGSNPMTVNNMSAATSNVSNAGKSATQGATATGGGSLMSRAMPMVGLALLANSVIQNSRANSKRNEEAETEKRMET